MKRIISLLLISFGFITMINAQTTEIKAKGVFAEIDVAKHNTAIETLQGKNKKRKQQLIADISTNPHDYNPPVIYALSREFLNQGNLDDATFWFYVAQLRARLDANICMDNSAKQAVSILNNAYGPEINNYAFQDIEKLEKTVTRVVEFVKTNEENYDHRWINLHGMWAIQAGINNDSATKELSQPKDKWQAIKEKTLDDYYKGFIEYVKNQKK